MANVGLFFQKQEEGLLKNCVHFVKVLASPRLCINYSAKVKFAKAKYGFRLLSLDGKSALLYF